MDTRLVRERWGGLLAEVSDRTPERYRADRAFPKRFLVAAGEAGLAGFALPYAGGGQGADVLSWGLVLEEVSRLCADPAFPLMLSINSTFAQVLLFTSRDDVVERYVRPVARGRLSTGLAYSEGADPFSMRTRITENGRDGSLVLNGRKEFVTGGTMADVFLAYAADDRGGLVACLVERGDPGVTVVPVPGAAAGSAGAAVVTFHDVPLPPDRVVARDGLTHAQRYLQQRRLMVGALMAGRSQALLERTVAHLLTVVRNGERVVQLPNIQAALGRMYIEVERARAMAHRALTRVARGEADPVFDPVVSAAKHGAVESSLSILDQAFRILGGQAYYGDPWYRIHQGYATGMIAGAGSQDLLEINLGATVAASHGEQQ